MLTHEERWRLRQAWKLTLAAEKLLDDCVIRKDDDDSAALYEAATKISASMQAVEALVSRFPTTPMNATDLAFAGDVL